MLEGLRRRLTYSNVMATVALFVALGGAAYALDDDSVKSRHIVDGNVKTEDVKNDDLKGKDVADATLTGDDVQHGSLSKDDVENESLTGEDVEDGSLAGDDIDESTLYDGPGGSGQDTFAGPTGGAFSAQIRDIGGDGETLYGSVSGRSTATATFADAATGSPGDTAEVGELRVAVAAPLAAGESRTFTLVRTPLLTTPLIETSLACTINADESSCTDLDDTQTNNAFLAIMVESSGASLSAGDSAYLGFAVQQRTTD